MEEKNAHYSLFQRHIPDNAVHYAYDLWAVHQFNFKITKKRNSKYGDYRHDYRDSTHAITINGDLNPYAFLITYLHEIAHLLTFKDYGRKVAPHGNEWKMNFRLLVEPVLSNLVFPSDLLLLLRSHMANPKATSSTDHALSTCLRSYDDKQGMVHLGEISLGEVFKLNRRIFKKEAKRRTRILCEEIKSGRKYLISQIALVEKLENTASE